MLCTSLKIQEEKGLACLWIVLWNSRGIQTNAGVAEKLIQGITVSGRTACPVTGHNSCGMPLCPIETSTLDFRRSHLLDLFLARTYLKPRIRIPSYPGVESASAVPTTPSTDCPSGTNVIARLLNMSLLDRALPPRSGDCKDDGLGWSDL